MDQPGSNRVAAAKKSPPVVSAPKTAEPMVAAADIGPISAYEQLASLSADGRPDPAHVLALQRAAGNRAVSRFMAGRTLQTKVNPEAAVGRSASESARGARQAKPAPASGPRRRDASRSRGRPATAPSAPASHTPIAQRLAGLDDEEIPGLPAPRPGTGFDASPDFESRLDAARGSGAPLPDATRAFMEERIGADFGAVKVHTDARSDALNQAIQAKAFTTGQDVFFRQGAFEPATSGGRELLAHELTHVVQQTGAAVPEPPVSIARTSAGARAIQAETESTTTDVPGPAKKEASPTAEPHTPTLEEELVAEGVAEEASFAGPAQKPGALAKLGASIKSAVRPNASANPVKIAIDKLDRAALDRIIDLISKEQVECTPQQRSWLGQRASAFEADAGTYETTLEKELAWERAASIAVLDRPGLERILGLIQNNKLKVKPNELQQLGRRRQTLLADASTYETTLANELAFEQVTRISELDRAGLDRIINLIDDGKLMITPAERQQLGRRLNQVGGASPPGEVKLVDALAREGVTTIGALDFEGIERVIELVDEKKLRLAPAELQQLGRRRSALETVGNKASKITLPVALAREGVATIAELDLAGVDGIADLIFQGRLTITPRETQQLGEQRRKVLAGAKTVTQYLKEKQVAENGTQAKETTGESSKANQATGKKTGKFANLTEEEAETILELVEKKRIRATNQEIYELSRWRKEGPAERERYETTYLDALAWEGAEKAADLSLEAAENIRERIAEKKIKASTAQIQELAERRAEKPAGGEGAKTTLKRELSRHGVEKIEDLDLEGIEAIRGLVGKKQLDLTAYYQQALGRRYRSLQAAARMTETTLEVEMAREGLGTRDIALLDLAGANRISELVREGRLKLDTATLLALGKQLKAKKAEPDANKTTLGLELAKHGATLAKIEDLDLEGVEAMLDVVASPGSLEGTVPPDLLQRLGQHRRKLLKDREDRRLTLQQELSTRRTPDINQLDRDAVQEIGELVDEGKLKLLPSEAEQLDRRRRQLAIEAESRKPTLGRLLASEGVRTIAELADNKGAVERIRNTIERDRIKLDTSALLELSKIWRQLTTGETEQTTLEEELASSGVVEIGKLDYGAAEKIWRLIEDKKIVVTNDQLLALARRRKEESGEATTHQTTLAEELAREDVDTISELDLKGVQRIWKLVHDDPPLKVTPDELRELAQRRKAKLSETKVYETSLDYELAKAKAAGIADLDFDVVDSILELINSGELKVEDDELAQLVRRQREQVNDGRALKSILAGEPIRKIDQLTPLWVETIWKLVDTGGLLLSSDQRRELVQRRKDQAAHPVALETALRDEGLKTLSELRANSKQALAIWNRVLEKEITLKQDEAKTLESRRPKDALDVPTHAGELATRLAKKLKRFKEGGNAEKPRSTLVTEQGQSTELKPTETETPDVPEAEGLARELSSAGVERISDLSYEGVTSITQLAEANVIKVTDDELRQLVSLRNEERKKREPEATTLDNELAMDGVRSISELDLEGAERIWQLIEGEALEVDREKRLELARRRATLLSTRKPETIALEDELARVGARDISGLDRAGLDSIKDAFERRRLKLTPEQIRALVRRDKALKVERTTLEHELALEGLTDPKVEDAIAKLDEDGLARILELIERDALKVDAGQLRQLHKREAKLGQAEARETSLLEELLSEDVEDIAELSMDAATRLIDLMERGALKVTPEERRELYQVEELLSEEESLETDLDDDLGDEGVTGQDNAKVIPREPQGRKRSNALVGGRPFATTLSLELMQEGAPDIASLGLEGVRRIVGLVESDKLRLVPDLRRQLYRRERQLTEPAPTTTTAPTEETENTSERNWQPGDTSVYQLGTSELGRRGAKRRGTLIGRERLKLSARERRKRIKGNPLEANFVRVLAREGVENVDGLDLRGVTRIRTLVSDAKLSLTVRDSQALAKRERELVLDKELNLTSLEVALAGQGVSDIAELDFAGVESIRELVTSHRLKLETPDLLRLGQQRKTLISQNKTGRTTLALELEREKVEAIDGLDLDAVERIRGLIAEEKLELTPDQLRQLAARRTELLNNGGPKAPSLADELALEGVELIADLDLDGVERIRTLVLDHRLTLSAREARELGQRRQELRAGGDSRGQTLKTEKILEGAEEIGDLDFDGVTRILGLVKNGSLKVSYTELKELGHRRDELFEKDETVKQTLTAELAREGARKIADLDSEGVSNIQKLVASGALKVTDEERRQLREHAERMKQKVTLKECLDDAGVDSIAGLDGAALRKTWNLVEANRLDATAEDLRAIARKRKEQISNGTRLSTYLAENGPKTISSLDAREIDSIWKLVEEKKLTATTDELRDLARRRKEQQNAEPPEPTTLAGELASEGAPGIDALELDALNRIWDRVAERKLRVTPVERRELGKRQRELNRAAVTVEYELAKIGAKDIASLTSSAAEDIRQRVINGSLIATPEEMKELGQRRKRQDKMGALAYELSKAGARDIASLSNDALEDIWWRVNRNEIQVSNEELTELTARHKELAGLDDRERKLPSLEALVNRKPAERGIQTKLTVGPVGDRYEREADRVARHVVGAHAPEQPSDEYYRVPAYPSGGARGGQAPRRLDANTAEPIGADLPALARPQLSVQAKLTVGPVGDRYEQEADRVARQVVAMRLPEDSGEEYFSGSAYASAGPRGVSSPAPIPRSPAPMAMDDLQSRATAQRAGASFDAGPDFEERLGAARAGGAPLPDSTRAFMERRMGADFGGVRVHADAQAGQLNRLIQAKAFTMGSDVFFAPGEYNPVSSGGKELLAHELAHTVQQGAVPVQRAIRKTEAPSAASVAVEDGAKKREEADESPDVARSLESQSGPAAVRRAPGPAVSGALADARMDARLPVAAGAKRPLIQRHLLGSLADLGRSILSTLASIPENLLAALRQRTGAGPGPLDATAPLAAPVLPVVEEAPLQPVAKSVAPPSIAEPPKPSETPTQESVRAKVNLFDPTGGDVVRYISDRITDVGAIEGLLFVVSRERLVDALANDLAARGGAALVDESHRQAAEREVANGGGGFTGLDGRIFILDTAAKSSALFHEVIHVLSGPGGVTPLAQLKMQLNEGFTNYFAEEVAGLVGGDVYAAYAFPTGWARKFAAAHGRDAAYNIYFKGNVDLLYEKMAGFLLTQAQANQLKVSEANLLKLRGEWSMDKALAMVKAKVKGADFFDPNALPNQWFDGRVF